LTGFIPGDKTRPPASGSFVAANTAPAARDAMQWQLVPGSFSGSSL
jgi:hypothetical protein